MKLHVKKTGENKTSESCACGVVRSALLPGLRRYTHFLRSSCPQMTTWMFDLCCAPARISVRTRNLTHTQTSVPWKLMVQLTQPAWSSLADEEMGPMRPHIWKMSSNPEHQVQQAQKETQTTRVTVFLSRNLKWIQVTSANFGSSRSLMAICIGMVIDQNIRHARDTRMPAPLFLRKLSRLCYSTDQQTVTHWTNLLINYWLSTCQSHLRKEGGCIGSHGITVERHGTGCRGHGPRSVCNQESESDGCLYSVGFLLFL